MSVSHREGKPKEKVVEIHGYDDLLSNFAARGMTGRVEVAALVEGKKAQKEGAAP